MERKLFHQIEVFRFLEFANELRRHLLRMVHFSLNNFFLINDIPLSISSLDNKSLVLAIKDENYSIEPGEGKVLLKDFVISEFESSIPDRWSTDDPENQFLVTLVKEVLTQILNDIDPESSVYLDL